MIFRYISLFIISSMIISCKFTEEAHFKSDGKIDYKYSVSSNMGSMLSGLENSFKDESDTTIKTEPESKKESKFKMDTMIYFKDMMDSVKNELKSRKNLSPQQKEDIKNIDFLKDFAMRMVMKENEMKMEILANNINDTTLNKGSKALNTKELKSQVGNMNKTMSSQGNSDNFISPKAISWNGNLMVYKGEPIKKESPKTSKSKKSNEDAMMGIMMQGSFTRIFKFDRPIKSVNLTNVEYSEDKKTMTVTYDMSEFEKSKKAQDIKVELE